MEFVLIHEIHIIQTINGMMFSTQCFFFIRELLAVMVIDLPSHEWKERMTRVDSIIIDNNQHKMLGNKQMKYILFTYSTFSPYSSRQTFQEEWFYWYLKKSMTDFNLYSLDILLNQICV